jgi:hypothetical protein
MFSKKIIDTDAFLDMPSTARLLYYDLAMRADDEGFIGSPKGVMRTTGASIDDINILIMRKFVIPFDSGVVVIRHWKIHNYIQNDRFKPTVYADEKAQLSKGSDNVYRLDTNCIQNVSTLDTQVRLGKDSKGKDSIGEVNTLAHPEVSGVVEETPFDIFWKAYPRKTGKGDARKKFAKALTKTSFENIMAALGKVKASAQWKKDDGQFVPYPATWLNQERWDDEVGQSADGLDNLRSLYAMAKEEEENDKE